MHRILPALAALALPAAAAPTAQEPPSGELYVRATAIHIDGERVVENGVLAVEDGKIRAVGRGVTVPEGAPLIEHDGVLTAGMVSCVASLGAESELNDPTRALLAEARAAHAYDPDHEDFEQALAAGITAAVLAPDPSNVAGGVSAVVRTDGSGFLERKAHLTLSLSATALDASREPTSYPGALAALGDALREPRGVWSEAASGELPVLLYARPRHEVARAVRFAKEHELRGALVGAPLAGELAGELAGTRLGVVVGPFGPGADRRALDSVLSLAEAGIPFAFASAPPGEDVEPMRFSAALCVRRGLERMAAWRALTSDAARLAGVDDRVGTLEPGKEADFVLWSDDPLELDSSVAAVYVAGRRVHGAVR